MRNGFVRLSPGQSVGWHTTGHNEESLVILHGAGKASVEGEAGLDFSAPRTVYIPPETKHNVTNTGTEPLEYQFDHKYQDTTAGSQRAAYWVSGVRKNMRTVQGNLCSD